MPSQFLVPNRGSQQKPVWGPAESLKADDQTIAAQGTRAGPYVADWDGGSQLDLLLGSGSGRVVWYRNTGTTNKSQLVFAGILVEETPANPSKDSAPQRSGKQTKLSVADWNGDGRPDLIVGDDNDMGNGTYRGWVWVFLRTQSAARTP
jgi:hypothetical protein